MLINVLHDQKRGLEEEIKMGKVHIFENGKLLTLN